MFLAGGNSLKLLMLEEAAERVCAALQTMLTEIFPFHLLINGDLGKASASSAGSCAIQRLTLPFWEPHKDEVYCLRHLQIKSFHATGCCWREAQMENPCQALREGSRAEPAPAGPSHRALSSTPG